ncbi:MAG: cache domain-containing protein [Rhodomicrobium sp.]
MVRTFIAATFTVLFAFTGAAFAQTSGTADEAKALLSKAVAALKADSKKAIDDFNNPTGGFRDRDLYVFCAAAPAYNFTAHPKAELRGTPLAALVDKKGKKLGEELLKVAAEDKVGQVEYFYPRPGGTDPVEKVTFVTKVGDEVCGVGYYK